MPFGLCLRSPGLLRRFRWRGTAARATAGVAFALLLSPALSSPAQARSLPRPLGNVPAEAPAREQAAVARYELGAAAFEKKRFHEAIKHFLAADSILPSAALSYNIALAYERVSHAAGALRFYRDYLRRAPKAENAAEVAKQIQRLELSLMREGVQQLTIRSEPSGATVRLNDTPVGVTPWTGELKPGEHQLALSLQGHRDLERPVMLPAAHALDVAVRLKAHVENPRTENQPALTSGVESRPGEAPNVELERPSVGALPWVLMGASGASLVAAGTFELLRQSAEDDARSARTQLEYEAARSGVRRHQLTARVLLGTSGALLTTSGVLFVLHAASSPRKPASGAVACGTHGCLGTWKAQF